MLPGTLCSGVLDLDPGSAHDIATTSNMNVHQGCEQAADFAKDHYYVNSLFVRYVTNASCPRCSGGANGSNKKAKAEVVRVGTPTKVDLTAKLASEETEFVLIKTQHRHYCLTQSELQYNALRCNKIVNV